VLRVQALQNKQPSGTGAGLPISVTTQIPEINPDFRILNTVVNKILTWRISDKKTVLHQRFRVGNVLFTMLIPRLLPGSTFHGALDTACKEIILLEKKNQAVKYLR
jgi:hypothetical protein